MLHAHKIRESMQRGITWGLPKDQIEAAERFIPFMENAIDRAGKFDLGAYQEADANVLRDTGIEQLREGILSFPFPYSYWEYTVNTPSSPPHRMYCIAAPYLDYVGALDPRVYDNRELFDGLFVKRSVIPIEECTILVMMKKKGDGFVSMSRNTLMGTTSEGQVAIQVLNSPVAVGEISEDINDDIIWWTQQSVAIMQALLNAKGVDVVKEEAPVRLNKARIAKGRTPLYDHHVVKLGGISSGGKIVGVGMERASPRKHWRRGHVRVLRRSEDNELKIVIPACLINGRGFISKEYEV